MPGGGCRCSRGGGGRLAAGGDRADDDRRPDDARDRPPLRRVFFDPGEGGAPLLYEHLAYVYFTGAYLIVFLAAAGAISEILPTFSRKPIFSHRAVAASFVAIGVLGPLAWMQNMYSAPLNEGWTIMAMAFALALIVPIGVLFYVWVATIWGGTLEPRATTWYALAAISAMAIGLAGELSYSVIPVGWLLDDTVTSQGDTLYVLVGGGVIGGFAALHYWFPKLCGRLLGEGLGKVALLLMFVGLNVYVLAMALAGLEGQPVDEYFEDTGVDGYNLVASLGAFVLVIGILLELGNAAYSWNNGLRARGHDPWGATLEWFALSPPPPHNFDAVPDVRSTEPLHDIRESIRRRAGAFVAPAPLERFEPGPAGAGTRSRRRSPGRRAPAAERGSNQARHLRRRDLLGSLIAMPELAARGDGDELARFRRLVSVTIAATLVLILIGGIVRERLRARLRFRRQGMAGRCARAASCPQPRRSRRSSSAIAWPRGRGRADRRARLACPAPPALAYVARARVDRGGRSRPAAGGAWRTHGGEGPRGGAGGRPPRARDAAARHPDRCAAPPTRMRVAPPPEKVRGLRATTAVAGCWSWQRSSPGATSPGPRRRDTRTNPPSARRTWRAEPAIRPTRSRPATASSPASARAGSPTSSSSTARSCTWPRSRCWRWRRSRSSDEPRAVRSGSRRCCCWRRSPLGSSTSGRQARRPDPRPPRPRDGSLEHRRLRWRDAPARLRARLRAAAPPGGHRSRTRLDQPRWRARRQPNTPAAAARSSPRTCPRRCASRSAGERSIAAILRDYVALTKPRIISLLLLTTVTTMIVADPSGPALSVVLWTMLGGYLAAGGAGAINHYLDRDRDARMARTRGRPWSRAGSSPGTGSPSASRSGYWPRCSSPSR